MIENAMVIASFGSRYDGCDAAVVDDAFDVFVKRTATIDSVTCWCYLLVLHVGVTSWCYVSVFVAMTA